MEMKRIPLVFAGTLEITFEPATTVSGYKGFWFGKEAFGRGV
jgi:hypothetical protein